METRISGGVGLRSAHAVCRLRRRLRQYMLLLVLVLNLTLPGSIIRTVQGFEAGRGVAAARDDAFEPTVTQEESRLLERVVELARTEPGEAVRLLQERMDQPCSAALDFALGNLLVQRQELDLATAAYERALKKMPRFRRARVNLGRAHLLQGRAEPALELYRDMVAEGWADADSMLLLGHALLMESDAVSAETAYRQSLLMRPRDADAMLGLAKAMMLQERYGEVLALVGPMLEATPDQRELWALKANAHLAMNRVGPAARAIELARRIGCVDSEMLATLGDLHLNQGLPEEAVEVYQSAFSTGALSSGRVVRALEGFLMLGDIAGAQRMLTLLESGDGDEEAPEAQMGERATRLRLEAVLARLQGEPIRALATCEEALRADPMDGKCLLLHAELLQAEARWEEAVLACERAARVPGFEADALVRQALIEVGRERYDEAIRLLEAAQAIHEQPHVARYIEQLRGTTSRAAALGPQAQWRGSEVRSTLGRAAARGLVAPCEVGGPLWVGQRQCA
ncbi:MAG: tetratricopeptide repeat protein [Verrucomicrobiota bacterium]|nr:tetratricopeptide repeat protein [Verrucomicrobiota bacterium]